MSPLDDHPRFAACLSYGAGLPLALLAAGYAAGWPLFPGFALQAFLILSAVGLAFAGGWRRGAAVARPPGGSGNLLMALLAPMWGSAAILLPRPDWSVWALGVGYLAFAGLHRLLPPAAVSRATLRLHLRLLVFAGICHAGLLLAL